MAPIFELSSTGEKTALPLNTVVERVLENGETKAFVSTPTGGFVREPYPNPDTILQTADVAWLKGNGILFVAETKDSGPANEMTDGAD